MKTDAYLSQDRTFRYWLLRVWDDSLPVNCSCGVNPSTADERENDGETGHDATPFTESTAEFHVVYTARAFFRKPNLRSDARAVRMHLSGHAIVA